MIKLMYITNNVDIAKVAESAGVDRIFIDMEYIGKDVRQAGMNTVQNHHTIYDVSNIRKAISKSELLVRCNPIHEQTDIFCSSKEEIDLIITSGADWIMLPYFKTVEEVETFINLVDGRAKTILLIETPEAVEVIDKILQIKGIDEVFVGLNDLSLGYGLPFMFELLANGLIDKLCNKFNEKGIPYGFGGIATIGKGMLNSEYIIKEHYRLGSTCAILSRSFYDSSNYENKEKTAEFFNRELKKIRQVEKDCKHGLVDYNENKEIVRTKVDEIILNIGKK